MEYWMKASLWIIGYIFIAVIASRIIEYIQSKIEYKDEYFSGLGLGFFTVLWPIGIIMGLIFGVAYLFYKITLIIIPKNEHSSNSDNKE